MEKYLSISKIGGVGRKMKDEKNKCVGVNSIKHSFIIDIVVDDDGMVWVVEVNPFGELAGSCLFGWSQDKAVLMGEKPFEFRIVEEPPSLGYVKTEIDERVLSIMGVK